MLHFIKKLALLKKEVKSWEKEKKKKSLEDLDFIESELTSC